MLALRQAACARSLAYKVGSGTTSVGLVGQQYSTLLRRTTPSVMSWSRSLHNTQFRSSIFSRTKITGDQGLRALSVPTQSTASSTFRKVAFYVKLARVPFLIVAIYGLGYRQGITDTVRNPLKLQQVSCRHWKKKKRNCIDWCVASFCNILYHREHLKVC